MTGRTVQKTISAICDFTPFTTSSGASRCVSPPSECPHCGKLSRFVTERFSRIVDGESVPVARYRCEDVRCQTRRKVNGFTKIVRHWWDVEGPRIKGGR